MTREEAIERIRSRYDKWALDDKDLEAIRYIFPSPEEKEERIRKSLVEYFGRFKPQDMWDEMLSIGDVLAYLEKPTAEEILIRAGLKPFKDGNQWCILAGDNIQEGICGFGDTIEDALCEFLKDVCKQQNKFAKWFKSLPSDLDGAANNYGIDIRLGYPRVMDETDKYIYNAFKAGAKWMAGQGVIEEYEVDEDGIFLDSDSLGLSLMACPPSELGCKEGDILVIQMRKKENPAKA